MCGFPRFEPFTWPGYQNITELNVLVVLDMRPHGPGAGRGVKRGLLDNQVVAVS